MSMPMQPFDHRLLRDHAFGIVGPADMDRLPAGVAATALVPAALSASAHLMPGLIDLRALPQEHADALLEEIHQAHLSGAPPLLALLVDSTLDAPRFARYWNARQLVNPRSGAAAWLRLHDPRVLHQLLRMLGASQRAALFGPVRALRYWIAGAWIDADAGQVAPGAAALPEPWDWDRIRRIGIINRALLAAGVHSARIDQHSILAEQLIARASRQHRMAQMSDLVEFATRGLLFGAAFDSHPRVAAVLALPVGDADSSLADRLALLDDDVWDALRQDPPAAGAK